MSLPFVEVHVRLLAPSQGKKGEEKVEETRPAGEVSEDTIDVDDITVIKP